LAADEAADLPFDGLALEQADAAARGALGGEAVDLIAQAAAGRRKRLLLADMDSTIVTTETLDELAAFRWASRTGSPPSRAGHGRRVGLHPSARGARGHAGGLPVSALERTWEATEMTPGASRTRRHHAAAGAHCVLVSGGFTFFTARVAGASASTRTNSNTC
jgi:phosphoserine phosphatase